MPYGGQLIQRVGGLVGGPQRQVLSPGGAGDQHHVGRTGGAHGIQHLLHAGHLPGVVRRIGTAIARDVGRLGAAVHEHLPVDFTAGEPVQVGFVEQFEHHVRVALERAGNGGPEGQRVVGMRRGAAHRLRYQHKDR